MQTAMKDHIVTETFGVGISLAALGRQVLFVDLDNAAAIGDSTNSTPGKTKKKTGGKKRKKSSAATHRNGNKRKRKKM